MSKKTRKKFDDAQPWLFPEINEVAAHLADQHKSDSAATETSSSEPPGESLRDRRRRELEEKWTQEGSVKGWGRRR